MEVCLTQNKSVTLAISLVEKDEKEHTKGLALWFNSCTLQSSYENTEKLKYYPHQCHRSVHKIKLEKQPAEAAVTYTQTMR